MLNQKIITDCKLTKKKIKDLKSPDHAVRLSALRYFNREEEKSTFLAKISFRSANFSPPSSILFDIATAKKFIDYKGILSLAKLLRDVDYETRYYAAYILFHLALSCQSTHQLIREVAGEVLLYLSQDEEVPKVKALAVNIIEVCALVFAENKNRHIQLQERLWAATKRILGIENPAGTFADYQCIDKNFESWKETLREHHIPQEINLDGLLIFAKNIGRVVQAKQEFDVDFFHNREITPERISILIAAMKNLVYHFYPNNKKACESYFQELEAFIRRLKTPIPQSTIDENASDEFYSITDENPLNEIQLKCLNSILLNIPVSLRWTKVEKTLLLLKEKLAQTTVWREYIHPAPQLSFSETLEFIIQHEFIPYIETMYDGLHLF